MDHLAWSSLNAVDGVMLLLVFLSTLIGVVRGFVKEALSLITWITATVVSALYFQEVGDFYLSGIQMLMLRYLLASILLGLGILVAGGIFNFLISNLIHKTGFRLPDRVIGAFFGAARGVFLLIVGVLIGLSFEKLQTHPWQHSAFIPRLIPAAHWLKERVHLPEKLREALEASETLIEAPHVQTSLANLVEGQSQTAPATTEGLVAGHAQATAAMSPEPQHPVVAPETQDRNAAHAHP